MSTFPVFSHSMIKCCQGGAARLKLIKSVSCAVSGVGVSLRFRGAEGVLKKKRKSECGMDLSSDRRLHYKYSYAKPYPGKQAFTL